MSKSRILIGLIVLLCISFTVFQFKDNQMLSDISRSFIVPVLTTLYIIKYRPKLCCFVMFLILFSISELMTPLDYIIPTEWYRIYYFIGNSLYILAYLALTVDIIKHLNFNEILKKFAIHLVVLMALNFYLLYLLHDIINPFLELNFEFVIEFAYNFVLLSLLSVSFLNYLYRENKKSLFLFLGALSIVFSEVIMVAYLYISDENILDITYTILFITAFYFLYEQTKYENEEVPLLIQKEIL